MRVPQPEGKRGSLRWIQRAVAQSAVGLEQPILNATCSRAIEWLSPLREDDRAEYRDGAFLERLGLTELTPALSEFWPKRGPQWDALGRTDRGDVLLVEAKAHIREMCSPPSQASSASREIIAARLGATAIALGTEKRGAIWIDLFYQLANRLAHVHFLREGGVRAWLILTNFIGDDDMKGPLTKREWIAAYQVAWYAMGLPPARPYPFLIEVFPDVKDLT